MRKMAIVNGWVGDSYIEFMLMDATEADGERKITIKKPNKTIFKKYS